jgi:hypothetical protein
MGPVAEEGAVALPMSLVAVTTTRTVASRSGVAVV